MTNHTALIQRLTEATEGSRELDGLVANAIRTAPVPEELLHLENRTVAFRDSSVHADGYCLSPLPHYTTSIDAALTLAPDGWAWELYFDKDAMAKPPCSDWVGHADIFDPGYDPQNPQCPRAVSGTCRSPALALCIAALRACDANN